MLTHHLQSFGRSCISCPDVPHLFHRTSNFPCLRWSSSFSPETLNIHGFRSPVPFHWQPPILWQPFFYWRPSVNFCGGSWTRGRSPLQGFSSCSINQLSCSMDPNDSRPPVKRRKHDPTNQKEGSPSESDSTNHTIPDNSGNITFPGNEMGNSCVSKEDQKTSFAKGGALHRKWEDFTSLYKSTSDSKEASNGKEEEAFDFSVMSYNILAQDLLENNAHLYRHCSLPLLQWGFRFPNILKELKQLDADILCLQEVQNNHYRQQLKPILESLGYHCEYKMRTGNKRDGCAICFKRSKFSLVAVSPVEFYRPQIQLLDRDNVGLVLLLQPVLSQSVAFVCIANTHLLYNPRRGDIKLAQLAILLAEINKLASDGKGGYWPIILCGDLNAVPESPLYNFIRNGKLIYDGLPIGKVSGQEQTKRWQRPMTKPLWPPSLGISSACQYETSNSQQKSEVADAADSSEELKDSTNKKDSTLDELTPSAIRHNFKLMSVYSHYLPGSGKAEVTTCHSRSAVTVDYIFYSETKHNVSPHSEGAPHDGDLQLLGKLALLTEQDLWTVNRLPNENNSSDHLPLLAKFRYKLGS